MDSFMLTIMLKTIPRIDAKKFDEGKIIIKSKNNWKNDIFNFLLSFLIFAVCFFVLTRVPYIGTLFFIVGFLGMLLSLMYAFRAFIIYKNYDDLFSEENIEKLLE